MSKLVEIIDNTIKNKQFADSDGVIPTHIKYKVKILIQAKDKGTFQLDRYKGLDKLIAQRVDALYKPSTQTDYIQATTSSKITKPSEPLYNRLHEESSSQDGYIVWAGNEAFLAPWLSSFISSESSENSGNPYQPQQAYKYAKYCTQPKFNTTTILTDQNRKIFLSTYKVAKLSKDSKKLIIASRDDISALETEKPETIFASLDLTTYLPEGLWSWGKLIAYKNYIIVQLLSYADDRVKDHFEKPKHYALNNDDALGYTVDSSLLFINLDTFTCKVFKVEHYTSKQVKTEVVRGYTDFIIHNDRIFGVRTKDSASTVLFKGFKLKKKDGSQELEKSGIVKHNFDSYTFELVEFKQDNVIKISDITIPDPPTEGKFGITGSKIVYTKAKLAASDLNPMTFYVQVFYALVFQFPYDYGERFTTTIYVETGLAERLRTDQVFFDWFMQEPPNGPSEYSYSGNLPVKALSGVRFGGISTITGELFIELPIKEENNSYTECSGGIIYELVSEKQPVMSPMVDNWQLWQNGPIPVDYYPSDWYKAYVQPLDAWVAWHLASKALGSGSSYTSSIIFDLDLQIQTGKHPISLQVEELTKLGTTVPNLLKGIANWPLYKESKWIYNLKLIPGTFPFPNEKWWVYQGGNRGTNTWAISGYTASCETFLATYNGDKFAKNGERSAEKAKPVLIVGGIGPYTEAWGAKGWTGQMTQSPLVIECFNYESIANIQVEKLQNLNKPTWPKVYMLANISVLGTIGWYYTGSDITDPTVELLHGMYPMPQNGYWTDENGDLIRRDSLTFTDMKITKNNLRQIYYSSYSFISEYNTKTGKYTLNNYILESAAYEVKDKAGLDLWAAKVMAYWWSKAAPALPQDPIPWFGPCQLDMHIKV